MMKMTQSALPRLFLWPLETHLDQMAARLLRTPGSEQVDFSRPIGEPALVGVAKGGPKPAPANDNPNSQPDPQGDA